MEHTHPEWGDWRFGSLLGALLDLVVGFAHARLLLFGELGVPATLFGGLRLGRGVNGQRLREVQLKRYRGEQVAKGSLTILCIESAWCRSVAVGKSGRGEGVS